MSALKKPRRWPYWLAGSLILIALAGVVGLQLATRALKDKIAAALGPRGEVAEIRVGFSQVEILGVKIRAADAWPTQAELSAGRIVVRPDLAALLDRNVRIAHIRVEDAYLAMLRRKDGKLDILPSLLQAKSEADKAEAADKAEQAKAGSDLKVMIDGITLANSTVEFFDASIRQPAHKLRLEQVNAELGRLIVPDLTGTTRLSLEGVVKGVQRDGQLKIDGQAEIATKESAITAQLKGVDLVDFQPYLIKAADTRVKKGSLNLDLKSTVRQGRLNAPGTLTLSGLELGSSGNSFMGMPRSAVVGLLKDKGGNISVKFVLEGNINDPRFSLNESFASRIGTGLADSLGISIEGLAKGIGNVGSGAAKGVGDTVRKLFGGK